MCDYEFKKQQKVRTLRNLKTFMSLNKVLCIAAFFPFVHVVACSSQGKSAPIASKVGSVFFGGSIIGALVAKNKEEKAQQELIKIIEKERLSRSE